MLYKDLGILPYCDFRIGTMFYFYENPINYKNELKEIFAEYRNITQEKSSFYRHNADEGLKKLRRDDKVFFDKIIDNSTFVLTEKYSIYDNSSLYRNLKAGIDGPNAVQVLSKDLYSQIGCEELMKECKENGLFCEMKSDYMIIAVSTQKIPEYDEEFVELYRKLNRILEKIKLDLEKPLMFWKPQEWDIWKNRFDS